MEASVMVTGLLILHQRRTRLARTRHLPTALGTIPKAVRSRTKARWIVVFKCVRWLSWRSTYQFLALRLNPSVKGRRGWAGAFPPMSLSAWMADVLEPYFSGQITRS